MRVVVVDVKCLRPSPSLSSGPFCALPLPLPLPLSLASIASRGIDRIDQECVDMDRSHELFTAISSCTMEACSPVEVTRPRVSASPFLIQCGNMMRKIHLMEKKISTIFDKYVNFHCQFQRDCDEMTDPERKSIDQEITIFAITWTTEINEMKRNCSTDHRNKLNDQSKEHFHAVITYLLDRLQSFTRLSQNMRRLHSRFSLSPYKLQYNRQSQGMDLASVAEAALQSSKGTMKGVGCASIRNKADSSSTVRVTDKTDPAGGVRPATAGSGGSDPFAERYSAEIAPPAKMKEYQEFAAKHKEALLAESKQLSEKYDEDLQAAHRAEQTVTGLFEMLNEFIAVMRAQEGLVVDVHDASQAATAHVHETDEQLLLTLQRSKSYQASTVGLIVGLAFFLLLLDALTP